MLGSARWIVLAVSTLLLVMPALGARADAYIYFANDGTGSVARFDPSNGHGTLDFVSGGPDGVAVNSTYIYWTNEDTFTIGRANLDGTDVDQNFITGLLANAVAANDKFIYWTEVGAGSDSIGRARIDGTGFDPTFISNLTNAGGIAVDAKHIYWTNGGTTTTNAAIGRANLAGTIVDPTYIPGRPGDGDYNGVAVDSKYVYWTNDRGTGGAAGSISRADLGVDDIDLDFITPSARPSASRSTPRTSTGGTSRRIRTEPSDPRSGGRTSTAARRTPSSSSMGWDPSTAAPYRWPSTRCPPRAPAPTRRSPARAGRTGCAGRTTTT